MKKIRAAVVGYGNIGKFTIEALEASEDFEIAGVVRRNGAENKPAELAQYDVVKDIKELKDVDVAILATPTRSCEEFAKQILPLGINTVDSFDIHTNIVESVNRLYCEYVSLVACEVWVSLDSLSDLFEACAFLKLYVNHTAVDAFAYRDCHRESVLNTFL